MTCLLRSVTCWRLVQVVVFLPGAFHDTLSVSLSRLVGIPADILAVDAPHQAQSALRCLLECFSTSSPMPYRATC